MPDIQHLIEVAAPPDAIWPLVSTGLGFTQWWAADVVTPSGEPGLVELGFFNRATIYRLRAASLRATELAEWRCESGQEWAGTRIVFTFTARGAKTQLRFEHADWSKATDYFVSCNTTWGELMFRLKAAAEGKAPGPLFLAASLAY